MIRILYWRDTGRPIPARGRVVVADGRTASTRSAGVRAVGRSVHQGYTPLDDALEGAGSTAERYRLLNEGMARLRSDHHIHPLETADVIAALAPETERRDAKVPTFGGFCSDTFRFLSELAANNRREWMESQRDRYHFAVRKPLMELCRALAAALRRAGVTAASTAGTLTRRSRSGHALTSICKNAYGRSQPYNTTLWIAFCPHRPGGRRDVQLFRPARRGRPSLRLTHRP